jgi:hypothetical protein
MFSTYIFYLQEKGMAQNPTCQRLIDSNVDLETASRLAGHKDINATKRYLKLQINKQKVEDAINHTFTNVSLD